MMRAVRAVAPHVAIWGLTGLMLLFLWILNNEKARLDAYGIDASELDRRVERHEVQIEGCSQKLDKLDTKMDKLIDMHIRGK